MNEWAKMKLIIEIGKALLGYGIIAIVIERIIESIGKCIKRRKVKKDIGLLFQEELKKNQEILDELFNKCEEKKADSAKIFNSFDFIFHVSDYVLNNLIELGFKAENFKKLMELKVRFHNIIFFQDLFINCTKDDIKLIADPVIVRPFLLKIEDSIKITKKYIEENKMHDGKFLFG